MKKIFVENTPEQTKRTVRKGYEQVSRESDNFKPTFPAYHLNNSSITSIHHVGVDNSLATSLDYNPTSNKVKPLGNGLRPRKSYKRKQNL